MILKRYFIHITIRVILIIITCYAFATMLQKLHEEYYYTTAGIAFLLILQSTLLVKYLNRINRDLTLFFSAIQNNDSTLLYPTLAPNKSYVELQNGLNGVNKIIQQIKTENEKKGMYLKNLIDHLDVALLAFNHEGGIELFNNAALKITGMLKINTIDDIGKNNKDFLKTILSIKPGENKVLKTTFNDSHFDLSIKASVYKFESQVVKLVSFQNIKYELERKELESWQKLIRILNHEIMNSLSPVISLTKTLITYFKKSDNTIISANEINQTTINKTLNGLYTIEETGIGLTKFIDNYRSITSLPKPELKILKIKELFANLITLMNDELKLKKISINTEISPENLDLEADFNQITQLLVNLIHNSVESLQQIKSGNIKLKAQTDNKERTVLQVWDNGPGIPKEIIDDIFIPFYTTKENGSGIGLSLARQIMRLHNGTIGVQSQPGNTIFMLIF
ncbi:MAG: GHKL domain-containing protein [Bacteroidales bacterium]|nr:GHKL domain-containing protein [Bacteroidales bacterium]